MKKIFCIIIMLFASNSCVSRVSNLGYIIDSSDYKMLQEGVTSKEMVLKIMGSPTIISDFDNDEAWVYYSEEVDTFLFFKPEILERTILVLRFDNDIIRKLKKIDHEMSIVYPKTARKRRAI